MPESKLTATRSVLLLENSLVAATQLRELLSALPGWHLDTTVHLSDAGIFPTSSDLHDLVLVADDYAHLNLSQIIEVAKCYQPHAHIVVLGTTLADARSPQQFVAAGRAGVNYWLQKDNISLVTLNSMLQQLFNDGDQPARLVNPATEAKPAPASPAAGVNLATEHNAGLATQADSILAEIPVGIIIFGVADDDFIYRRINRAAAESTQLKA